MANHASELQEASGGQRGISSNELIEWRPLGMSRAQMIDHIVKMGFPRNRAAEFCPNVAEASDEVIYAEAVHPPRTPLRAFASLTLGIAGLTGTVVVLPLGLLGLPAIFLGYSTLETDDVSRLGRTMAGVGLVCGVIGLLLTALLCDLSHS